MGADPLSTLNATVNPPVYAYGMDKRVLLTVFVAVGLALGVALLAFGVFMWMNRFPWTSVLPGLVMLGVAGAVAGVMRRTA